MKYQLPHQLLENLELFIPRILLGTTEDQISEIIRKSGVGFVESCELVISPKTQHKTSAKIRLYRWSSTSGALEDFELTKSIKLHLTRDNGYEYWTILPNQPEQSELDKTELEQDTIYQDELKQEEDSLAMDDIDLRDDFDKEVDALLDLPLPMKRGVVVACQLESLEYKEEKLQEDPPNINSPPIYSEFSMDEIDEWLNNLPMKRQASIASTR